MENIKAHGSATSVSDMTIDDVDALIDELDAQFKIIAEKVEGPTPAAAPVTHGCTVVTGCTGSCPCSPEEPEVVK